MFQAGDFLALALISILSVAAFFIAGYLERIVVIKNDDKLPKPRLNRRNDLYGSAATSNNRNKAIQPAYAYSISDRLAVSALYISGTDRECISVIGLK